MNLRRCFPWMRAAPVRRAPRRDWVDALEAPEPAPNPLDEDRPLGCGWFDSSHELHAGLLVTEHLSPEPVANEVPLGWWLDWQHPGPALPASAQRGGLLLR